LLGAGGGERREEGCVRVIAEVERSVAASGEGRCAQVSSLWRTAAVFRAW